MRGKNSGGLKASILSGEKWGTCRAWKPRTIAAFKKACELERPVRLHDNWGRDSIWGWVLVASVGPPVHPDVLVTPQVLRLTGCSHLSKAAYIEEYCMESCTVEKGDPVSGAPPVLGKRVCPTLVFIAFARIWDLQCVEVPRPSWME